VIKYLQLPFWHFIALLTWPAYKRRMHRDCLDRAKRMSDDSAEQLDLYWSFRRRLPMTYRAYLMAALANYRKAWGVDGVA
jgi:hypothetical protein